MIKQITMKTAIFLMAVLLATFCHAQDSKQEEKPKKQVQIEEIDTDSVEYELLIFEIGFDTWLLSQRPMNFYSEEYYKSWNQRYVIEYNIRYRNGPQQELYESEIQYDYMINYGIELEYKLYNYFLFFEQKYGVTLVKRGKKNR